MILPTPAIHSGSTFPRILTSRRGSIPTMETSFVIALIPLVAPAASAKSPAALTG